MEAAKSTINIFYQRCNSLARPIYASQSAKAPPHLSCPCPFVCVLTLPAIHRPAIASDRSTFSMPEASFQGTGPRKKDAEAAAAACALEWLQNQEAYAALIPQPLDSSLAATISRVLQSDKVQRREVLGVQGDCRNRHGPVLTADGGFFSNQELLKDHELRGHLSGMLAGPHGGEVPLSVLLQVGMIARVQ